MSHIADELHVPDEARHMGKEAKEDYQGWQAVVRKYQQPSISLSAWQIINSFGGLLLCLVLMYFSLKLSYLLTLLLAFPTAGFLVRVFIIQHDAGHASLFKSRRANDLTGMACSLFTLVPYKFWQKSHAVHHAHHAELEERGIGDVWTMTVDEYMAASPFMRLVYRVFRHPIFLFGIAPTFSFVVMQRFSIGAQDTWHNGERASVIWTNIVLAVFYTLMGLWLGFGTVLMIYLPVIMIGSSVGTWLFYVQHQYERTYWEHTPEWDYTLAAMHGSSYYKLPPVLQWFTGNIGFHHIHHLSPRIPNYNLQKCHEDNPILQRVEQLTLKSSLKTTLLALWDEKERQLISFREAIMRYGKSSFNKA
ncbi:MAG: fatty acid desaturase [Deinococcales bacterium]